MTRCAVHLMLEKLDSDRLRAVNSASLDQGAAGDAGGAQEDGRDRARGMAELEGIERLDPTAFRYGVRPALLSLICY